MLEIFLGLNWIAVFMALFLYSFLGYMVYHSV